MWSSDFSVTVKTVLMAIQAMFGFWCLFPEGSLNVGIRVVKSPLKDGDIITFGGSVRAKVGDQLPKNLQDPFLSYKFRVGSVDEVHFPDNSVRLFVSGHQRLSCLLFVGPNWILLTTEKRKLQEVFDRPRRWCETKCALVAFRTFAKAKAAFV